MTTGRHETFMGRMKGAMMKRVHGMITCREFEEFVIRYLDGELSKSQARMFEWHMRMCRECREYLAAYRRSMEITRTVLGADDDPVPDDVPEDLVTAILDARRQS